MLCRYIYYRFQLMMFNNNNNIASITIGYRALMKTEKVLNRNVYVYFGYHNQKGRECIDALNLIITISMSIC